MKKVLFIALAVMFFASMAMAQLDIYTGGYSGTPIPGNYDKLGAHQNGGRGCVGCHAPHSGARGNGGNVAALTFDKVNKKWVGLATVTGDKNGNSGDEVLWGQDLGPVYGLKSITTAGGYVVTLDETTSPERVQTGIVMCLSCHDGAVAKGAMMTNQSFEQLNGLLPNTYGTLPIPTLLGADGGVGGNYSNDHPLGTSATAGKLGVAKYFALDNATAPTKVTNNTADATYNQFITNYANPIGSARAGAGWAIDNKVLVKDANGISPTSGNPDYQPTYGYDVSGAYVVCTTCHTPHTMYTSKKVDGTVVPSFFFIAAPYNPSADIAGGTKASSATQFCRSCHFTGAGGSNESAGITAVKTAF